MGILCAIGLVWVSLAADWPRLGGTDGLGISPETGISRDWPPEGPPIKWTLEVGEGFAGAAIRDGQVYFLDRVDDQQDGLRCLDLNTGQELWKLAYDAPGRLPYNGSRNVVTVDESLIFAAGPLGHFSAVDRQTHQIRWARHLVKDFKSPAIDVDTPAQTREEKLARAQLPMWGLTQAPLVYGDLVIVAPQTQKVGVVAYEKNTGKIRWRSGYIGRNWYSHVSPTLAQLDGVDQIIMLAQPSDPEKSPAQAPPALISAIAPATGQVLWQTKTPGPYKIPMPQPLVVGPNRLFITGGYGLGCLLLEVKRNREQWETRVVYHQHTAAAHIHSPIYYRDKIYVLSFKEHGGSATGLACLDLAGKVLWQTGPGIQFDFGGLLVADGLALVMQGKTGELHLFDLVDAPGKLLGKAKVLEAKNNMAWSPLALSRGILVVRDQHQMKGVDLRAPPAGAAAVTPGR